jgi:hypothetical protein
MGRRFARFGGALLVATAAAVAVYWSWPEPPQERPADITEHKISPAAYTAPPATKAELAGRELVALFALAPAQGFPGTLAWSPALDIGAQGGFPLHNLLHAHPLLFLELCADRYNRQIQGYTCTFVKKERINDKLFPPGKNDYEIIKVACGEHPFSVFFEWKEHPRLAARALFVEGANENKILAKPRGVLALAGIQQITVDDPRAKDTGRYPMSQFGMGLAIHRTVRSMHNAAARGTLHLRYEGQFKVEEVGDRVCYKFVRTPFEPLEEDRLNELTLYIDVQTWLQVGSVLRDPDGNLLAEYFFRDIVLNPPFSETQFTRKAL